MDNEFVSIMEDYTEFILSEQPLLATRVGDHRFNDSLGNITEERMIYQDHQRSEFLSQLEQIDSTLLSESNQLNYLILKQTLENAIAVAPHKIYRMPISTMGGFHDYFPVLGRFVPLNNLKDYQNLLSRYREMPDYIRELITNMRNGLRDGQIPPKITLRGVPESIQQQLDYALDDSPYLVHFTNFPASITEKQQHEINGQAIEIVTDGIFPAIEEFLEFLTKEYIPNCREEIGASSLPDGLAFYQKRIKHFTSLDLTPQEIHDIGLSEVRRIRAEMEQIMKKVEFTGDLHQFFDFLRTDERFYVEDKEKLLEKTALVLKKIDGMLPQLFKTLPRLPYGIREIPEFAAPNSTTAYYMPGAGDGTKAGNYYVNTFDLKSRPLYEIEALSLHEAVPGHHLQIALQQEVDIPKFRRFTHYTSFVEGWALYTERLGLEVGFYEDPYSDFGRLSYEMWRATRLVVDTGMHALGWSRQEAIDFMADNSSLTLLNITNEVDRYIGWPGQALAYKLGELKIRELRKSAEEKLGDAFNIREFHDCVLLQGSLPLDVLDEKVNKWIDEQL